MEKLTYSQIKNILEDLADRKSSEFELNDFLQFPPSNPLYGVNKKFKDEVNKLGIVKPEGSSQDIEGMSGEKIYTVFHFVEHDVYIKFGGEWSSYNDNQFDYMKEVRPVTKTVTVYE